jgi:two-component system response regulator YesN
VKEMKAIIIDDEKHVREGLMLLADWEKHGIDTIIEAEDGEEAAALIKEHNPEIIFTDMRMPRRDGISLLKWLHAENSSSKTIVVSGYDDFEYMRHAIAYKSFDYILKPIEPDVLNEILERAVHEWREQARSKSTQAEENRVINEVKPLYWDQLFSGLCLKKEVQKEAEEKIEKEYCVPFSSVKKFTAVLSLKSLQKDREAAMISIAKLCSERLKEGVCFKYVNKEDELVLLIWKKRNPLMAAEEIIRMIERQLKIHVIAATGNPSIQLNEAYREAEAILQKRDLRQKMTLAAMHEEEKPLLHLFDFSSELKWTVQSGSIPQTEAQLVKIFAKLEQQHNLSLEQIALWENQFNLLRSNWLKEYEVNHKSEFYSGKAYWNADGTFSMKKFKDEKTKEFMELITILSNVKYQKEKNNMQQIEEYLQEHYQEDITLQEIADKFFLSREYISRKFKQDYHATLTDYLTNIRMQKAKSLLKNPYLKIYEIAYGVGYQNEKYFSKVFKKYTGQTPNEYRQSAAI